MATEVWSYVTAHYPQIIDSLLVAVLLYAALVLTRGTKASVLLQAVVAFTIVYLAAQYFQLATLAWLTEKLLIVGPVAAVVVFAPDIRLMLERASQRSRRFGWIGANPEEGQAGSAIIEKISAAAEDLAAKRTGALIVVEQRDNVDQYIVHGERLDALCSERLLLGIFDRHNPMHDGAVLMRNQRVHSAGCFLPLADGAPPDSQMGTRHRAALGITERCDALAIAVSEQRGEISLAFRGRMARGLTAEQLAAQLQAILEPNENHSTLVLRAIPR